MKPLNADEFMDKLMYVAAESGKGILKKTGRVFPFGISLNTDGENVRSYYPRDEHPSASWEQLMAYVEAEMRNRAQQPAIGGIAMVTELESGTERGMSVHAETNEQLSAAIYPFRKRLIGWHFYETQHGAESIFSSVYDANAAGA
jgi:hypothetical protein